MPVLTVLHTNDLHARFEQLTRLGTLIQKERARASAENRFMLLLDAGDSSSAGAWESAATEGRADHVLLEALGYDAAAVGNSDSQWGAEALERLAAAVHFPLLAANLRPAAGGELPKGLRGYALFRFDGLNAAVAGLTTTEAAHPDFRPADPAAALQALLPELQAAGAQVIVVLSHLGIEADRRLAAAVPGLHLIVGGHTHTVLLEPEIAGDCAIVQAGEFGSWLGRADLDFDPAAGKVTTSGRLIPCDPQGPPDPTAAGMLELIQFEAAVARKKHRPSSSSASSHPHSSAGC